MIARTKTAVKKTAGLAPPSVRRVGKALMRRVGARAGTSVRGGPIIEFIDVPWAGEEVSAEDELVVAGWAYSHAGAIERVEVFLDGVALGPAEYGAPRPDVADAHNRSAMLNSGYFGRFELAGTRPGRKELLIRITDAQGNRAEHRSVIELSHRPPKPRMMIDEPRAASLTAGDVIVNGWLRQPGEQRYRVWVLVDGQVVGHVPYGIPRPDVQAAYGASHPLRCGFYGHVQFGPKGPGEQTLVVQATGSSGDVVESRVAVAVVTMHEPLAEIERVTWRGTELAVEGWAMWPTVAEPRQARIFVGGLYVGQTRVHRSRPDLRLRFPSNPQAAVSGFRFVGSVAQPEVAREAEEARNRDSGVELRVEFIDGFDRVMQRSLHVVPKPAQESAAQAKEALDGVIDEFRLRVGRDPVILDWDSRLDVAALYPTLTVFSPPHEVSQMELPYLDGSVDLVVHSETDVGGRLEAARVAEAAVVRFEPIGERVRPPQARQGADGEMASSCCEEARQIAFVNWKDGIPGEVAWPSVSIVVCVHNKIAYTRTCLKQLQATVPQAVMTEIIVVDDASTDETPQVLAELMVSDQRIQVIRNHTNAGFLESCNRGANEASGDVLVMLNNDTLPQSGWLQALLMVLRDHSDAGAVGGKLIYPDGTLQEAGAVIFTDGSGANYGRGDSAVDRPLYNYVREVDYCSGALLATPRRLWNELGGFDTRYRPAYYEDADYCFRVREAGYHVYYQPEARIIHFEGVSSGTDLSSGVKSYQVINRAKFSERWNDALQRQSPPAKTYEFEDLMKWAVRHEYELEAKRGNRRVLICAPGMPEFDREGGSRRTFHMVEFLRRAGWDVSYLAHNATGGARYARILQQLGVATYAGNASEGCGDDYLANAADLIKSGQFAVAILVFWHIADYYLPLLRSLSPETRVIVDSVDLHFLRQARILLRPSGDEMGLLTPQYADELCKELNVYAAADTVLTVSKKEADLVNDFTANAALACSVPLMEDIPPSDIPFSDRRGLLFVGNFRHPPNVEAVEFLFEQIVPRLDRELLAEHPISVVGNGLEASIRRLAKHLPGVRMVGWVPSLVPYLHTHRATIVPLLHGAGTKTKLIQALTVGTPSVSTTVGVEGLRLTDGDEVLIADNAEDLAAAVRALLTGEQLWRRLQERGKVHVAAVHGREAVRVRFMSTMERMLRATGDQTPAADKAARNMKAEENMRLAPQSATRSRGSAEV